MFRMYWNYNLDEKSWLVDVNFRTSKMSESFDKGFNVVIIVKMLLKNVIIRVFDINEKIENFN